MFEIKFEYDKAYRYASGSTLAGVWERHMRTTIKISGFSLILSKQTNLTG